MEQKIEKDCGACPFFKFCAAHIIEEKIRNIRRIMGQTIHKQKWSDRFCFNDFVNCIHFEGRKKVKPFVVREKERFELSQRTKSNWVSLG